MKKPLLFCLSLLCFTFPPHSALRGEEIVSEAYESLPVGSIEITAENLPETGSFDSKTIVGRLKTQIGDPFSQAIFDEDLKTLAQEYDRIDPTLRIRNEELYITIKVWPRPTIRLIKWEGNEHISARALKKELGLSSGKPFNRQTFHQALNKVKELYIKKGYFEAQFQYRLQTDPKKNEVDLVIEVDEGRSGKIDEMIFHGFTKSEESALLSMIHTQQYNLFRYWFLGTGLYKEEPLEQDRMTIINFLQNEGYADAKIDIHIVDAAEPGKIVISISAEKGAVYHFGRVTFDGNVEIPDKEIEEVFIARPNGIYSPDKLHESVRAIKELYGRKGYIEASVHFETKLDEHSPLYSVHFQIEEGGQYKIGLIHILGNVYTQDRVILRESLLIPGETFDSAKLQATEHRLNNMGYFKSVNVYSVRTQDDVALGPNYRDVYIDVKETTTGSINLFFGASTADSAFGGLDLSESNFNIKGFGKLFKTGPSALRGGGEYAHIRATIGKKQSTYSISWLDPYLNDTLWRFGFDISKSDSTLISKDYHIDTFGTTVYSSYPLTPFLSFGLKYRWRDIHIHVAKRAGRDARKEQRNSGILSAAGPSLAYDSTDSPMKPHRGYRTLLEFEYTGLGGEFEFLKFSTSNNLYTPLWRGGIMKYRFDFAFIEPFGKTKSPFRVPLSERYFQGGDTSVRGYEPYDLGPQFNNGDPTGGISTSVLSLEYLHEVLSFLDVFVFADAGAVSMQRFNLRKYNASYGFGARLELMNKIPFILGMGFPVNPDRKSQIHRFFFSMGGQF